MCVTLSAVQPARCFGLTPSWPLGLRNPSLRARLTGQDRLTGVSCLDASCPLRTAEGPLSWDHLVLLHGKGFVSPFLRVLHPHPHLTQRQDSHLQKQQEIHSKQN